jgi:hypothetical protein
MKPRERFDMNKLTSIAVVCTAVLSFTSVAAQAEGRARARGAAVQADGGARAARSGRAVAGDYGAAGGQRAFAADGEGNASGAARGGFTTESGARGGRYGEFNRSDDGSFSANGNASAEGDYRSADRSSSFNRDADGNASGERSTTLTNKQTGNTFEGSTTYEKGEGVSRSAACTDASGNGIDCGSR